MEEVQNMVAAPSPEEPKKIMLYVVPPEQWAGLLNVLGACPSALAGEAYTWARTMKPTELNQSSS